MNLDDLRRLSLHDVGNWPMLPKALVLGAIFFVIIGIGAFFDWKDQWETLGRAEGEEVTLREQYAQKKAKAINFDAYRAQLSEVEQSFGALVKQLPNRSEIDALLTDINQAGLGRGLQFELFRPSPQEKMQDFYAELPIKIKITGTYHDMGAFASDVAQLPRIVTLNDLQIANEKGTLSLDAEARTFRYLDDDEIAKQRSKDPGSKDRGGDLDWAAPGNFVKPFSEAMVKLPKGKFTAQPVQTQFGWHVIEVTDIREAKIPGFDEVKPQLQQRLQAQNLDAYFKELRAKGGL